MGGQVGGLASDDGFNYYIGGYQLYPVVREATVPVEDHDAKGHVWHRLSWDAPREWRPGGATEDLAVAKEPIHPRSETTYLNIIGALVDVMLGKSPDGKVNPPFNCQAAIIFAMVERYNGKPGISQRTLEQKFADANRSLKAT